jgi:hypothetical protein
MRAEPKNPYETDVDDLPGLINEIAELPMTAETPGVGRDDLLDALIGLAREWRDRQREHDAEAEREGARADGCDFDNLGESPDY